METLRGSLAMSAFEGEYPPWSTPSEVEHFFTEVCETPQMKRAYELGKIHRGGERDLNAEEVQELDDIVGTESGVLFRWMREVRDRECLITF